MNTVLALNEPAQSVAVLIDGTRLTVTGSASVVTVTRPHITFDGPRLIVVANTFIPEGSDDVQGTIDLTSWTDAERPAILAEIAVALEEAAKLFSEGTAGTRAADITAFLASSLRSTPPEI